jgi:hypothetical protein
MSGEGREAVPVCMHELPRVHEGDLQEGWAGSCHAEKRKAISYWVNDMNRSGRELGNFPTALEVCGTDGLRVGGEIHRRAPS